MCEVAAAHRCLSSDCTPKSQRAAILTQPAPPSGGEFCTTMLPINVSMNVNTTSWAWLRVTHQQRSDGQTWGDEQCTSGKWHGPFSRNKNKKRRRKRGGFCVRPRPARYSGIVDATSYGPLQNLCERTLPQIGPGAETELYSPCCRIPVQLTTGGPVADIYCGRVNTAHQTNKVSEHLNSRSVMFLDLETVTSRDFACLPSSPSYLCPLSIQWVSPAVTTASARKRTPSQVRFHCTIESPSVRGGCDVVVRGRIPAE